MKSNLNFLLLIAMLATSLMITGCGDNSGMSLLGPQDNSTIIQQRQLLRNETGGGGSARVNDVSEEINPIGFEHSTMWLGPWDPPTNGKTKLHVDLNHASTVKKVTVDGTNVDYTIDYDGTEFTITLDQGNFDAGDVKVKIEYSGTEPTVESHEFL